MGFTFPGIIELPGSFSGIVISPSPHLGPLASHLISLDIFSRSQASALMAPWENTSSSFELKAWNLFSALANSSPVISSTALAASIPKSLGALSPVPTAVAPSAKSKRYSVLDNIKLKSLSRVLLQPLISCAKLMGVAS